MNDAIYWTTIVLGGLLIVGGFIFGIYDTYIRKDIPIDDVDSTKH